VRLSQRAGGNVVMKRAAAEPTSSTSSTWQATPHRRTFFAFNEKKFDDAVAPV
jgi:hypothetical protein